MLRFNPPDGDAILPAEGGTKVTDRGAHEMSRHLLNDAFHQCYHKGMDALLPPEGAIAAVLYSAEHGNLLITDTPGVAVAYNFTDRQRVYERK
jgi:hypothetical protein